jgi:hypothetical protein
MIRDAQPGDERDIHRLCLAQYLRTPWPIETPLNAATGWRVCERNGHVAGVMSYSRIRDMIFCLDFWVEDGLAGARAARELGLDMVALSEAEGLKLAFCVNLTNPALQRAVERFGYRATMLFYSKG